MAFYHTPHIALGGELSLDYMERSKVMSYNSFFTWVGGALTTWIALTYFFKKTPEYPRGLLNPDAWAPFAVTMALVAFAALFASAWFTRDRIRYLPQPLPGAAGFSPLEFVKDIKSAFSNMNYVWLLVGFSSCRSRSAAHGPARLHQHLLLGPGQRELRWFIVGTFGGYATAFYMAAKLHGRFESNAR